MAYRAEDYDPTGENHGGTPTFPKGHAPKHLMTRRQLMDLRLRPGGQPVVAQLVYWNRGRRLAWLYDVAKAKPIRPLTPAKAAALEKAMRVRRTCPKCEVTYPDCIPLRSLGSCWWCTPEAEAAATAAA